MKIEELENMAQENLANAFYISFSDLMVLLCTFFVMMLGMSQIDIGSFEKIRAGFIGHSKGTLVELADKLKYIAEKDPGVPGVKVELAADGVRLDLDVPTIFTSGSAVLKPHSLDPLKPILDEILSTKYNVDVEGHTDDQRLYKVKEGEEITNWSLSGRRASSVIHHLIAFGFKPRRMKIVGYASTRPKIRVKGKRGTRLKQARSENRRVTLLIK